LIIGFTVVTNTSAQAQYPTYRGYERDDRYNGSRDYRNNNAMNMARQTGYRDGFNDGADAARESDRYHPQNSGDWQKGTNGYDDRYGNKSAYKNAYRDAYMQGYRAAFDQVRNRRGHNNRGNWNNY
jgi:hypothetical protein